MIFSEPICALRSDTSEYRGFQYLMENLHRSRWWMPCRKRYATSCGLRCAAAERLFDEHLAAINDGVGVPVPGGVFDGAFINHPDVDLADPEWNTSGVPWHTPYPSAPRQPAWIPRHGRVR
jgi:hypothetical protein